MTDEVQAPKVDKCATFGIPLTKVDFKKCAKERAELVELIQYKRFCPSLTKVSMALYDTEAVSGVMYSPCC